MIVGPLTKLLPVMSSWVNAKPLTGALWMPLSSVLHILWRAVWFRLDLPSLLMRMSGRTESKAYRSLERLHLLHPFYLQGLSLHHRRKLNWSGTVCSSKSHVGCYPVYYALLGDCKLIILMIYLSNFPSTVFQAYENFFSSFKDGHYIYLFSCLRIFFFLEVHGFFFKNHSWGFIFSYFYNPLFE